MTYPRRVAQDSATPSDTARPAADGDRPTAYRERLTVPLLAWPIALACAAFLAAEVFLGAPTPLIWLPYAVLLPGTAVALLAVGRILVHVSDGELSVDDAHLPVTYVTEVNVLDANAKRALLGPVAERYAFIVQRPWISGAVRVVLNDPADPTPYWVVSSRRPAALAAAIIAARDVARPAE
jgi:Protein of unknown function (DUF3093)